MITTTIDELKQYAEYALSDAEDCDACAEQIFVNTSIAINYAIDHAEAEDARLLRDWWTEMTAKFTKVIIKASEGE